MTAALDPSRHAFLLRSLPPIHRSPRQDCQMHRVEDVAVSADSSHPLCSSSRPAADTCPSSVSILSDAEDDGPTALCTRKFSELLSPPHSDAARPPRATASARSKAPMSSSPSSRVSAEGIRVALFPHLGHHTEGYPQSLLVSAGGGFSAAGTERKRKLITCTPRRSEEEEGREGTARENASSLCIAEARCRKDGFALPKFLGGEMIW